MDASEDDIYTIAGRLATFERPHHFAKRRASQTASKKKAQSTSITWPHSNPSPEQLARAGFYYRPSSESRDSVTCFLCDKALDGWDPQDNPALEHLSHVSHCGWAINVCIEQRSQQDMDPASEDHPLSDKMLEARRATFRDVWPHQSKKGWKCKLDKMVEAGWCYNPLPEADDCVQCFYCGVSLDGWEPKDDPWEEHQRRAPDCHFFALVNHGPKPKAASKTKASKAKAKAKNSRASKASRTSTQSNLTQASDVPSVDLEDTLATQDEDNDDTVVTVISATSKTAPKSRKKAAAPKSRAAQSKKHSTLDDSIMHNTEETAAESAQEAEPLPDQSFAADVESSQVPAKKPRATRAKKASTVKNKTTPAEGLDDQLPVADESVVSVPPAASLSQPKTRGRKQPTKEPDISADEDNQEILAASESTNLPPPSRKASKAKPAKKNPEPEPQEPPTLAEAPAKPKTRGKKRTSQGLEKVDSSVVLATEIDDTEAIQPEPAPPKRGRIASRATKKQAEPEAPPEQPARAPPVPKPSESETVGKVTAKATRSSRQATIETEAMQQPVEHVPQHEEAQPSQEQPEVPIQEQTATSHPPTPPAKPPTPSIASSPQSSDAENQPPSSRPSLQAAVQPSEAAATKVPLKQSTPSNSPSKRNAIAGALTSTAPWTAVDLEAIFLSSPELRMAHDANDKENMTVEAVMQSLTSPEKKMSVEQWILWNAGRAEEKLKVECERLIGVFEGEGVRALQTLEGIECVS